MTTRPSTTFRMPLRGAGSQLEQHVWGVLTRTTLIVAVISLLGADQPPKLTVEDDDELVAAAVAERQFVLSEQQFDQMIFGAGARTAQVVREANGVQRIEMVTAATAADLRKRLESALATKIQSLDAQCSLNNAQKKKLGLAGRGDIHQFFSRVAEMRPKLTAAPLTRARYTELMSELQPLRTVLSQGVFEENSLYRKTLQRALTDEQHRRLQVLVRQQQAAAIDTVLNNVERTNSQVKLDGETRRKVIELLVERGRFPPTSTPYMQYIVLLEANRLEEHLLPLLGETYWQTFQTQVVLARRFEPTLRRNGQWPVTPESDDEPAEPATKK